MADYATNPSVSAGRDMAQPYHGPESGPGISTLGRTSNEGLRAAMEFSEMIVDTIREGLLVLDLDLCVQAANESYYRMFGASRAETEGRRVYELGGGIWNVPELRDLLERVLPELHVFEDYEVEVEDGAGVRRVYHLNARRLNHHQMVLLVFADVTERVRDREALDQARRDLEQRVEVRTRQARALASKLATAEQAERERIAHVLHDDLQQQLFGLAMVLSLLKRETADDRARMLADEATVILDAATQMTRTLATELSPAVLQADRIEDLLAWISGDRWDRYGLDVAVEVEGDPQVTDQGLRVLLYQVVRELLFNVVKHAGATNARLVASADRELVIAVEDDGDGFDVEAVGRAPGGFGMSSAKERLEAIGGRLEVASVPGRGTRVTVAVPLSRPA